MPQPAAVDANLPDAKSLAKCRLVAEDDAAANLCAPGGSSCAERLAQIMGVEVAPSFPYRAVVHCAATWNERLGRGAYHGESTCAAANLVAGYQSCIFGCLGLADCVRACQYDAIDVVNGLALVDYDHCIGCRACVAACPRNIISMVPFKAERMPVVACSNQDFGNDVRAVCRVGCIGCKACTRNNEMLQMEGNLPILDYDAYQPEDAFQPILEKCSMESLLFIGKPTAEDMAAVAHEEMPGHVEADFQTTVDHTEWRG